MADETARNTTPLDEAEQEGLIGKRLARDVREAMAVTGRMASDILSETGGEPLPAHMAALVDFLAEVEDP